MHRLVVMSVRFFMQTTFIWSHCRWQRRERRWTIYRTTRTEQHRSAEKKQRGSRNESREGMKRSQCGHAGSEGMQNGRSMSCFPLNQERRAAFFKLRWAWQQTADSGRCPFTKLNEWHELHLKCLSPRAAHVGPVLVTRPWGVICGSLRRCRACCAFIASLSSSTLHSVSHTAPHFQTLRWLLIWRSVIK